MAVKETGSCDFCFRWIEGDDVNKIKVRQQAPFRGNVKEYTACPHCIDRITTFMGLLKKDAWEKRERRIK